MVNLGKYVRMRVLVTASTIALSGVVVSPTHSKGVIYDDNGTSVEVHCPEEISSQKEIMTHRFWVRYDEILFSYFRGELYRIPIAYSGIWNGLNVREQMRENQYVSKEVLGFIYWMPSGRHVEFHWGSIIGARVCEPGRPLPRANEYIARIIVSPKAYAAHGLWDPDELLENRTNPSLTDEDIVETDFGLVEYHHMHLDLGYYGRTKDGSITIFMECLRIEDNGLSPSCILRGFRHSDNLYIRLVFSSHFTRDWEEVLSVGLSRIEEMKYQGEIPNKARVRLPVEKDERPLIVKRLSSYWRQFLELFD